MPPKPSQEKIANAARAMEVDTLVGYCVVKAIKTGCTIEEFRKLVEENWDAAWKQAMKIVGG